MALTLALASGATAVSLAFAAATFERWLRRRRRHELAWSVALALFACGRPLAVGRCRRRVGRV
jgi:hypothetical protein